MARPALRRLETIERMLAANEATAAVQLRMMAEMTSRAATAEEELEIEANLAPFRAGLAEMQRSWAEQRAEIERLKAEVDEMARAAAERWARHPPPPFVFAVRALLAAYL